MTKVSVLVELNELYNTFEGNLSTSQLYSYVEYKFKPFFYLHLFSYIDNKNVLPPIIGRKDSALLKKEINRIILNQNDSINDLKQSIGKISSIESLCEHELGRKLLALLAGKATNEMRFYDIKTNSTYLSNSRINSIMQSPSDYIIIQINLHR